MAKPVAPLDRSFVGGTWRPVDSADAARLLQKGLLGTEKIARREPHCNECGHLAGDHGLRNPGAKDQWRWFKEDATPCEWRGCECKIWRPRRGLRNLVDIAVLVNAADAWIEVPMGGAWIVAYRIVNDHGTPVVGEIRVFPAEPKEGRELGRWSGELLGARARVPRRGITSRQLRRIRVRAYQRRMAEQVARLREQAPELASDFGWDQGSSADVPNRDAGTRRGRKGRPDEFYADIAAEYVRAISQRSRRPIADIARQRKIPASQVRDMIRQARKRKLLTGAGSGLSGGVLTARAQALLVGKRRRRDPRVRARRGA
jgi:transposase-like protein